MTCDVGCWLIVVSILNVIVLLRFQIRAWELCHVIQRQWQNEWKMRLKRKSRYYSRTRPKGLVKKKKLCQNGGSSGRGSNRVPYECKTRELPLR
jgi:hypothetical protein